MTSDGVWLQSGILCWPGQWGREILTNDDYPPAHDMFKHSYVKTVEEGCLFLSELF